MHKTRGMWADLVHAWRVLLRSKAYAATTLFVLVLGIGANTAIFSVFEAVLLRPLPYPHPEQLVVIRERLPAFTKDAIAVPSGARDFFGKRTSSFERMAAVRSLTFDVSNDGSPERVHAARTESGMVSLLDLPLARGRWFTAQEDANFERVCVISQSLWKRRFGARADVIGRTMSLDREPYKIIGVLAPNAVFPPPGLHEPAEVVVPFSFTPEQKAELFDNFGYDLLARVRAGVTEQQVRDDLERSARELREGASRAMGSKVELMAEAQPLAGLSSGQVRPLLWILMGTVGFVLLIAVVNASSLALSHIAGRRQELAIRVALGASRWRVLREVLTGSLLLSLAAGGLGVLAAVWTVHLLLAVLPPDIPRASEIGLNWAVVGFALATSVVSGLVMGAIPGWAALRREPQKALRAHGRGTTGSRGQLSRLLVVSEFALAFLLLAGAGLLVRSMVRIYSTGLGYQADNAVSFSVALPERTYRKAEQVRDFTRGLEQRLGALPGSSAVGVSSDLPLQPNWTRTFTAENQSSLPDFKPLVEFAEITPGYFPALATRMLSGRALSANDREGTPPVIVVNSAMAKKFWGGISQAIGQRVKFAAPQDTKTPWSTVVGVVEDMKDVSVEQPARAHAYAPQAQGSTEYFSRDLHVVLRTALPFAAAASSVRGAVAAMDAELPVIHMGPLEVLRDENLAGRRFRTDLLVGFGALALILAILGIASVMRNSVVERRREIGVRLAMGAAGETVTRMVLGEAAQLIGFGILAGVAGALVLTRLLASLLYGVSPYDLLALMSGGLVLASAGLVACWLPARQAGRVDPMIALRGE